MLGSTVMMEEICGDVLPCALPGIMLITTAFVSIQESQNVLYGKLDDRVSVLLYHC
jgi:hypothetical protein